MLEPLQSTLLRMCTGCWAAGLLHLLQAALDIGPCLVQHEHAPAYMWYGM
jgi:hypothetical protein